MRDRYTKRRKRHIIAVPFKKTIGVMVPQSIYTKLNVDNDLVGQVTRILCEHHIGEPIDNDLSRDHIIPTDDDIDKVDRFIGMFKSAGVDLVRLLASFDYLDMSYREVRGAVYALVQSGRVYIDDKGQYRTLTNTKERFKRG